MSVEQVGPYAVELTNTDKVLFPDDGITKGELIAYYRKVSEIMLPHLKDRPLTLHRFPDGIGANGFYQQNASDYFPEWIRTQQTPRATGEGAPTEHVICDNLATLVYLANQAAITLHGWGSRLPELERPDRLVFDLDPSSGSFDEVRRAARLVAGFMDELGLTPFSMTTGSRGLHVVAPLRGDADFDAVRALARDMASRLASTYPDSLTVEHRKNKRGDRIYLDVTRNAYGQTTVMPYAVRALPGAPVATPLSRAELYASKLGPQSWSIKNLFRRLGQKPDPWADIDRHAVSLETAISALDSR